MANTPRLLVEIAASIGTFQADFGKASAIAEREARKISKSVEDVRKQVGDFGRTVAGAIGIPLTAGATLAFFDQLKNKVIEGENSINQLNAVLRLTKESAGLSFEDIQKVGQGIQGSTVFDDEQINAAATALLRFRSIQGDVFKQTLQLAPDVAAALGTRLPEAATILGKALTNPAAGLRQLKAAGIELSEQQIDMITRLTESGNRLEAMKIVLDEVAKSTGGAAGAQNEGLSGAFARLTRELGDLQKAAGRQLFGGQGKLVDELTESLHRLREEAEHGPPVNSWKEFFSPFDSAVRALREIKAFAGSGGGSRFASGQIAGATPDQAQLEREQSERDQRLKARSDQAYAEQQAAIKHRAATVQAELANELGVQVDALTRSSALYAAAYQRNEISTSQFYDHEREVVKAQARLEQDVLKQRFEANAAAIAAAHTRAERQPLLDQRQLLANEDNQKFLATQQKLRALDISQAGAIKKLKEEYEDLSIAVQELNGDVVGAAGRAFDLQTRAQRDALNAAANSLDPLESGRAQAAIIDLNAKRDAVVQQTALNRITTAYGVVLDEVNVRQSRVDLLRQTGAVTELESIQLKADEAQKLIPTLSRIADIYEQIARTSTDPLKAAEAAVQVEKLRLEIDQLAASSDVLAKKFTDIFTGNLTTAIDALVGRTKSIKDIIRDLGKGIEQQITHIASQNISESLFKKDGPLGGVGGFFADLFGQKGGAQTGAAALTGAGTTLTTAGTGLLSSAAALQAAAAALTASGAASGVGGFFSGSGGLGDFSSQLFGGTGSFFGFPGFAGGTDSAPGGFAVVGERGPELVRLPQGSQVIPNNVVKANFGRSHTFNTTVQVVVQGTPNTRTLNQVGLEAYRGVTRAARRVG